MIHTLQNHLLEIRVSDLGAELQNLTHKKSNKEYLWQGDPTHWGRRSPVLFPIVGALKDGQFLVDGKTFELGQHGFARNKTFKLTSSSETELAYLLTSSEETRQSYPYDFELTIKYLLADNQLTVQYQIKNPASEDLLFSIGAHPAFKCPLNPGEKRSDYSLVFEKPESISRQMLVGGTRNGETRQVLNQERILPLEDHLFDEDALILEGLASDSIAIQKEEQPILTMNFKGFPYFGIWSMSQQSPFVCLEPWFGIADHNTHNQRYTDKEGIIKLAPEEIFECAYHLTVH